MVGEQNPLFDEEMATSSSLPPAPEITSETTVTDNSILFDMTTPEVSNEPVSIEEQPAPITGQTAIESMSIENTPEISQSSIDFLTTAEPITMNFPEIKSDTVPSNEIVATDTLDIFSAEIQNNEINNNEDAQSKQITDDLGFLDAFG